MNRAEFMRRLSALLNDVPPSERDAAMQYYNDYFDDAGAENEGGVIASLGTPEELARSIKAGLNEGQAAGEFTESGFHGYAHTPKDEVMNPNDAATDDYYRRTGGKGIYGGRKDSGRGSDPYSQPGGPGNGCTADRKKMSGGTIALLVILAVVTFPVWAGLLSAAFGIVMGLFAMLFGIFVAFLAVGIALIVAAAALFITGFAFCVTEPLAGISLIGCSLIALAFGIVFVWLTVLMAGAAIPAAVKLIGALGRKIFNRGRCAA